MESLQSLQINKPQENDFVDELDFDGEICEPENSLMHYSATARYLIETIEEYLNFDVISAKRKFSPLDINEIESYSFNGSNLIRSAVGLEDLTLDNLAVRHESLSVLSGSGTRLATEWWTMADGYECHFIQVQGSNFIMMFVSGQWQLYQTNYFLSEGAEYIPHLDTLIIRQDCPGRLHIMGMGQCKIEQVKRYTYTDEPQSNYGIVTMVDGRLYRCKVEHTVDLLHSNGKWLSRNGQSIALPVTEKLGNMVYELTLQGKIIKSRPDKLEPDTIAKFELLKTLPTLHDLQKLYQHIRPRKGVERASVYPDIKEVSSRHGVEDSKVVLREQYAFFHFDTTKVDYEVQDPMYLYQDGRNKYISLSKYGTYFRYTQYLKSRIATGAIDIWDVRHELHCSGIYQKYDSWRVCQGIIKVNKYRTAYMCDGAKKNITVLTAGQARPDSYYNPNTYYDYIAKTLYLTNDHVPQGYVTSFFSVYGNLTNNLGAYRENVLNEWLLNKYFTTINVPGKITDYLQCKGLKDLEKRRQLLIEWKGDVVRIEPAVRKLRSMPYNEMHYLVEYPNSIAINTSGVSQCKTLVLPFELLDEIPKPRYRRVTPLEYLGLIAVSARKKYSLLEKDGKAYICMKDQKDYAFNELVEQSSYEKMPKLEEDTKK